MPTNYGLPNQGNVNTFSPEWLQSMYPYATFGPQMAQQLSNLQFGAGLDAQSQNNALAMQLAQGSASNRFADNIASKLALQGQGAFPAAGSAFGGGNWGVQQVRPPNIMDIYQQMNQGLGNMFGTAQQAAGTPAQTGYGQPVGDAWERAIANPSQYALRGYAQGGPIPFGQSGLVGEAGPEVVTSTASGTEVTPFSGGYQQGTGFRGGATPNAIDALLAMRAGNTALAQYYNRVSTRLEPFDPAKVAALARPIPGPAAPAPPQGVTPDWWIRGGTPSPAGGMQPNPFAPLHQLAFGGGSRPGAGPAYFSPEMLGTGSPGFGAPRTNLTGYYGASPDQREAQDYFMTSQAGYSPQQLAYERQAFTPGARLTRPQTFGY